MSTYYFSAEQTFCWLGRFKKCFNSLPKYKQLFFMHRMVKRRNQYVQFSYQNNKTPLLPSVKDSYYKKKYKWQNKNKLTCQCNSA